MSAKIILPTSGVLLSTLAAHRKRQQFGVGGCSTPMGQPKRPDPRCFDPNYLSCCHTMVPAALLSLAGQEAGTIQVQPQNSSFFKPCAIAMTVTDSADPGLDRRVRVFAASIQGCPQLGVRNTNPDATSTDFFYSDQWDPRNRDGCACPISWGTFSNLSNSYPLEITVFNPHPVGIDVDVSVTIFGDPRQCAPECGCGEDKGGLPSYPQAA